MITFSQLGKFGRLGNVLWQYAALRGIGLKTNNEIVIPKTIHEWHGQKCLIDCFNIKCRRADINNIPDIYRYCIDLTRPQLFDENVFKLTGNIDIVGYLQNMRYFSDYEYIIKNDFKPTRNLLDMAVQYHHNLRHMIGHNPLVSVHFRRGDVSQKEYTKVDIYAKNGLYEQYFKRALALIYSKLGTNINFLVFTGGNRGSHLQADIEWCKQYLYGHNIFYCENKTDIEDFNIMRLCDHHITCHVTTFGWWAAYLNNNPNKIVIAPKTYHWEWVNNFPTYFDIHDFYPKEWNVI